MIISPVNLVTTGTTMEQQQLDAGTIAVLILRLKDYRLPRAKRLLKKVNEGQKLCEYDIKWLKTVHADSMKIQGLVKRNPEYSGLLTRAIDLCLEIISKGLENESPD
jgi:hypothetical protein